jgi:hypothetical protein
VQSDEDGVLLVGYGPWPIQVPPVAILAPALLGGVIPWAIQSTASAPAQQAELDPEALERLKALGYITDQPEDDAGPSTEPSDSSAEEPPPGDAEPAPADDEKEQARAKLENVSVALQLYAFANREEFPPDLATLTREGQLSAEDLVLVGGAASRFRYIGGQTRKSDPNNVLVYRHVAGQGALIATVEGQVKHLDEPTFAQALSDTNRRLGR